MTRAPIQLPPKAYVWRIPKMSLRQLEDRPSAAFAKKDRAVSLLLFPSFERFFLDGSGASAALHWLAHNRHPPPKVDCWLFD